MVGSLLHQIRPSSAATRVGIHGVFKCVRGIFEESTPVFDTVVIHSLAPRIISSGAQLWSPRAYVFAVTLLPHPRINFRHPLTLHES